MKTIKNSPKIGEKYGYLTVIDKPFINPQNKCKAAFVLCRCDCGIEKLFRSYSVRTNKVKCCAGSCLKLKEEIAQNLKIPLNKQQTPKGNKYGRVTTIEEPYYSIKYGHKIQYVKGICECGKIKIYACNHLKRGKIRSCGCLHDEVPRKGTLAKNGSKKCSTCQKELLIDKFAIDKSTKDKLKSCCKRCTKNRTLKLKYDISIEEYEELLTSQNYRCACCGSTEAGGIADIFHVDHEHNTSKVRGLLCYHCNQGIGLLGDNIEGIEKAFNYLNCSKNQFLQDYVI